MPPIVPSANEIKSWSGQRRSSAAILRDIDDVADSLHRLYAELDALPPERVDVVSAGGRGVSLHRDGVGDSRCVVTFSFDEYLSGDAPTRRSPNAYLSPASAGELRDWLNHYYPKEAS